MGLLSGPVLSLLPWEGKAVLVLAAFARSYGEFGLLSQLYRHNPLANAVALLKQLPQLLQDVGALNPKIEALNNLIKEMLEVTRCIIEFSDPTVANLLLKHPEMANALSYIPIAVYWIIRSALTASAQVVALISMSQEYPEDSELPILKQIHEYLQKQLESCIGIGRYRALKKLFRGTHVDNLEILRAIFPSKDDNPFIRCSPNGKVHVESLRGKVVLLLFSDLEITEEDSRTVFSTLRATYNTYSQKACEVVWIPIIDQVTDRNEQTILKEAAEMPWLTAYPPPPPHLNSAFVKYVRKEWRFSKKAIMVALDAQGQVTNTNAHHMINIWGADAYPFSTQKEASLWKAESWKFQFLFKGTQHSSISGKKQICLYGGDDIEWIKSFTSVGS